MKEKQPEKTEEKRASDGVPAGEPRIEGPIEEKKVGRVEPEGRGDTRGAKKPGGMRPSEAERSKARPDEKPKKTLEMVIRLKDTDLDGSKKLIVGISGVKGVGYNLANSLILGLGMDPNKRLGDLSDPEIEKIEKAIEDPGSLGIPRWMFNRQRDYDTGKDIHLSTSDLIFAGKSDIDRLGEIKSYKGIRHARGLKVRGQRTASTGRGRVAVGVLRRKNAKAGKT
jgi:small subunit ribosomal protein S13